MKLLLTSEGLTNDSIKNALKELTEKPFDQLRLTFIPTAANVEDNDKNWLINDMSSCQELGLKSIDIVDISALDKEIFRPRLERADILLFGGGNTFHLLYWIKKSGLEEILPDLLKTRVYVGISAGSMVVTPTLALDSQSIELYEEKNELKDEEALHYVNFHIRPHLNSPFFPKVTRENIAKIVEKVTDTIYALDDNSAVQVINGKAKIISEGEWIKFN